MQQSRSTVVSLGDFAGIALARDQARELPSDVDRTLVAEASSTTLTPMSTGTPSARRSMMRLIVLDRRNCFVTSQVIAFEAGRAAWPASRSNATLSSVAPGLSSSSLAAASRVSRRPVNRSTACAASAANTRACALSSERPAYCTTANVGFPSCPRHGAWPP